MADKVQLEAGVSVEALVTELTKMRQQLSDSQQQMNDLTKNIKDGMTGSAESTKVFGAELNNLMTKIERQAILIKDLRQQSESLGQGKAFDDTKIIQLNATIAELEAQLATLKGQTAQTGQSLSDLGTKAGQAAAKAESLKSKIAELKVQQSALRTELNNTKKALDENDAAIVKFEKDWQSVLKTQPAVAKQLADMKLKSAELKTTMVDTTKQIDVNAGTIKNLGKELNETGSKGNAFQKIWSGLRVAANILPGVGIAGLLSVVIDPLIAGFDKLFNKESESAKHLKEVQDNYATFTGAVFTSSSKFGEAIKNVAQLTTDIQLAKEGFLSKKEVVEEYNKSMGKVTGQVKTLDEAEQSLVKNADAYIKMMYLKTVANAFLQEAVDKAVKAEKDRPINEQKANLKTIETYNQSTTTAIKSTKQIAQARIDADKTWQKESLDLFNKYETEAAKIAKDHNFHFSEDADKRVKATKDAVGKELQLEQQRLAKIAELEKQLADARVQAMEEGRKKEIALENARYQAALNSLELLRNEVNNNLRKDTGKLKQLDLQELSLINQNIEAQEQEHNRKLINIDKKYYDDAVKALMASQDAINAVLNTGQQKDIADVNKRYEAIFKALDDAQTGLIKKINEGVQNPQEKKYLLTAIELQRVDLEETHQKELKNIDTKYAIQRFDVQKDLALKSIDLLHIQGLTEEELTKVKEHLKLEAEKTIALQRLDFLKKQYGLEGQLTADFIKKLSDPKNIAGAAKEGKDIFDFLGLKINENDPVKIKEIKDQLLSIFNAVNKARDQRTGDLFHDLGFSDESIAKINKITKAMSTVGDSISQSLGGFIQLYDQRIDAIDKLISKYDEQISKQQEAVDKEKALSEKGLRNNLDVEQQRLSALQQQRQKELDQEKKVMAERAALQKAQIIADTIAQTSNLITAATEIYKVLAPLGPIGVAIAAGSIALMLGGFIASKIAAFKAVDQAAAPQHFAEGGDFVLDNQPSHKDGGVGVYDRKGKKIAELEGGEYIVKKRSAQKHKKLVSAINKDDFSSLTFEDLMNSIEPSKLHFNYDHNKKMLPASSTVINNYAIQKADNKKSEDLLLKIAENTEKLLRLESDKPLVVPYPDRTEIIQGIYKRIIRKKQPKENDGK